MRNRRGNRSIPRPRRHRKARGSARYFAQNAPDIDYDKDVSARVSVGNGIAARRPANAFVTHIFAETSAWHDASLMRVVVSAVL